MNGRNMSSRTCGQQLALFVLPSHEEDSPDEEDENSNTSARDTEEEDEFLIQDEDEPLGVESSYWSIADQSEFLDLLKRFGPDWLSISRHMKTKTETMVRNYFNRQIVENPEWQQIIDEASSSNATAITKNNPTPEPNMSEEQGHTWDDIHSVNEPVHQGSNEERRSDQGRSSSAKRFEVRTSDTVELHGGSAVSRRPAELDRIDEDGTAVSIATGEVVDTIENIGRDFRAKRTASEERADEEEIMQSVARRKKNANPEELAPKKCREPGCTKEFKRPCDLTKHEKTHSRPWKCPIEACKYHEYGWPTEKEMDRHFSDKHSIDPPRYKCLFPPCPYKSKRESNCKQHMEKAHGWRYVRTKANESNEGGRKAGSGINETPGPDFIDIDFPVYHPESPPPLTQDPEIYEEYGDYSGINQGPVTDHDAPFKDKAVKPQAPESSGTDFVLFPSR
ncbi:hypothetical protein FJTKL_12826 [Diaporthe vaccinii]|uniref:C2H2-type domain-containing protein n=1 Tax=Diaporthe vaccinii TaxID=105482 RepID=A0ABR4F9Q7_9PEZI